VGQVQVEDELNKSWLDGLNGRGLVFSFKFAQQGSITVLLLVQLAYPWRSLALMKFIDESPGVFYKFQPEQALSTESLLNLIVIIGHVVFSSSQALMG
jgi:hypothetical protein